MKTLRIDYLWLFEHGSREQAEYERVSEDCFFDRRKTVVLQNPVLSAERDRV